MCLTAAAAAIPQRQYLSVPIDWEVCSAFSSIASRDIHLIARITVSPHCEIIMSTIAGEIRIVKRTIINVNQRRCYIQDIYFYFTDFFSYLMARKRDQSHIATKYLEKYCRNFIENRQYCKNIYKAVNKIVNVAAFLLCDVWIKWINNIAIIFI